MVRSRVILSEGAPTSEGRRAFRAQELRRQSQEQVQRPGQAKAQTRKVVRCKIKATNCRDYNAQEDLCMAQYRCRYKVLDEVTDEAEDGAAGSQD